MTSSICLGAAVVLNMTYSLASEHSAENTEENSSATTQIACVALAGLAALGKNHLSNHKNFSAAVKSGSIWRVKLFIAVGVNVNHTDNTNTTALMVATSKGHIEIVKILLSVPGIDVNQQDVCEFTALTRAVKLGRIDIVNALLSAPGIDVNNQDRVGAAALKFAVIYDHIEIVKALLATNKIEINQEDGSGLTVLMRAAQNGQIEITNTLLSAPGIDINQLDGNGLTALMHAAKYGHTEIVQELMSLTESSLKNCFSYLRTFLHSPRLDFSVSQGLIKKIRLLGDLKFTSAELCDRAGLTDPAQIQRVRDEFARQIDLEVKLRGYGQVKKELVLPMDVMRRISEFIS